MDIQKKEKQGKTQHPLAEVPTDRPGAALAGKAE
jgi:hypothetical protein